MEIIRQHSYRKVTIRRFYISTLSKEQFHQTKEPRITGLQAQGAG